MGVAVRAVEFFGRQAARIAAVQFDTVLRYQRSQHPVKLGGGPAQHFPDAMNAHEAAALPHRLIGVAPPLAGLLGGRWGWGPGDGSVSKVEVG